MNLFCDTRLVSYVYHREEYASEIAERKIPYIDLTFVLKGELEYECNGEPLTIRSGEAIVFPSGAKRQRWKSHRPASYVSFNVLLPEDFETPLCGKIKNALTPDILLLLEKINIDYNTVTEYSKDKCLSIFFYLLMTLEEIVESNENPHVKMIKQYIHDHLSDPISLDKIAESVHLVPRYVCALFKKHTGATVTEYISAERIARARELILTVDISLAEISVMCGFADYNYFSRVFKRIMGVTASTYKQTLHGIK